MPAILQVIYIAVAAMTIDRTIAKYVYFAYLGK